MQQITLLRPIIKGAQPQPAVFISGEGALLRGGGDGCRPGQLELQPGAIEAIRFANGNGYLVIVVAETSAQASLESVNEGLKEHGARIDALCLDRPEPDGSAPDLARAAQSDGGISARLVRRAKLEWPIDRAESFMIRCCRSGVDVGNAFGLPVAMARQSELLEAVQRGITLARKNKTRPARADLAADAESARRWLFDKALPFWWEVGYDRKAQCFHEQIAQDGVPARMERRIMVQARQTFVYARAGRIGWSGPWQEAVRAGMTVLLERGLRSDGGTRHLLDNEGRPLDERRDLYDLAFVLLALAECGAVLPDASVALAAARRLVDWVEENWRHPAGGYTEGEVVPPLPRRQNPHMHMLEALLALYEVTGDAHYLDLSGKIAVLARDRLYQSNHGVVLELYDERLLPLADDGSQIFEPGHQFEWSYLLHKYHALGGLDFGAEAECLRATGEIYGVDRVSGMTHEEVFLAGRLKTDTSRLWNHAERLKVNLTRFKATGDAFAANNASQAFRMMMSYCDVLGPALWLERRRPDGTFIFQNAPASSLYHIVSAISELNSLAE